MMVAMLQKQLPLITNTLLSQMLPHAAPVMGGGSFAAQSGAAAAPEDAASTTLTIPSTTESDTVASKNAVANSLLQVMSINIALRTRRDNDCLIAYTLEPATFGSSLDADQG